MNLAVRLLLPSLAVFPLALAAADVPRIVYSKSFPGSSPPYMEISLERDGTAVYKDAPDDEQPMHFRLKEEEAEQIFALAAKLDKFNRKLESGRRAADARDRPRAHGAP